MYQRHAMKLFDYKSSVKARMEKRIPLALDVVKAMVMVKGDKKNAWVIG